MRKPKRTEFLGVRLSAQEFRRLQAVSERGDVTMSQLVRLLLIRALPEWEKALDENRLALL